MADVLGSSAGSAFVVRHFMPLHSKGTLMTSTARRTTNQAASANSQDATAMLRADHKVVSQLFAQYDKTRSAVRKKDIATKICNELSVHAEIEEDIFYPAVQQALKDKELVPEATVEHATLKDLIAQVKDVEPDGEMFNARIKVLSEYVKHHVKEEQNEMFPKARGTDLDMKALGARMAQRKAELLAAMPA
jgi:hemerythrin superfamily protein